MARKKFERTTRRFQLRKGADYPQDMHVLEVLDYAKSQKREVEFIRNAVELFYDLEQGNLDALYSKFPQYRAAVGGSSSGGAGDLDEIKSMLEILVTQNKSGLMMQPPAPAPTGKLLGGGKVLSAPVEDDEPLPDLVLRKDSGSGLKASQNFMKGMMSLQ